MSIQHEVVRAFITLTGRQRPWRSAEALDRSLEQRAHWPATPPPSGHGVETVIGEDDGWRVVRLVPAEAHGSVVALHGGAYVAGPEPQHWTFWRTIAVAAKRQVVVPLYRLAPEGTAAVTVPHVVRIVEALASEGPVALLGDSAGAGMALAAAQVLAKQGIRPPILMSAPWLDGAVTMPWTTPRDPWLAAPGLRHAADLYRGDLPVEHPFISPLLGELAGLGPIVVVSGTRDVLHRDALRLEERCADPVRVIVGEGLLHNPPLLPIPEARGFIRAFVDALR